MWIILLLLILLLILFLIVILILLSDLAARLARVGRDVMLMHNLRVFHSWFAVLMEVPRDTRDLLCPSIVHCS